MEATEPQLDFPQRTNDVEKNTASKSVVIGPVPNPSQSISKTGRNNSPTRTKCLKRSFKMEGNSPWFRSTFSLMVAFVAIIIVIYRQLTLEIKIIKLEKSFSDLVLEFDSRVLAVVQSRYSYPSYDPSLLNLNQPRAYPSREWTKPSIDSGDDDTNADDNDSNNDLDAATLSGADLPASHGGRYVRDAASYGGRYVRDMLTRPTSTEPPQTTMGCLCPPGERWLLSYLLNDQNLP